MASGPKIVWPIPDLNNEQRIDQGGQVSIGLGGAPSPVFSSPVFSSPVFCCQNFAGRGALEHGVRRPLSPPTQLAPGGRAGAYSNAYCARSRLASRGRAWPWI
jgi:hypothetical protein